MSSSVSSQARQGLLWLLSGSSVEAVLRILFTAVLARILEPSDFGLLASAMVVIGFADLFSQFGLGAALVQTEEITDRKVATGFSVSLLIGFGFMGLLLLLNPLIADFYRMPRLVELLNVLVILFPLRSVIQVSYSLLQRDLAFKRLAGLDVLSYCLGYGFIGIGLALSGYGVWSLVIGVLAQALIYALLLLYRSPFRLGFGVNREDLNALGSFGFNFTTARFFNYLALKSDYVLVGRFLGDVQLGFYSRAYGLMNAPNNIAGKVVNSVLFASFSKVQADERKTTKGLSLAMRGLLLIVIPLSVWCYFLAPDIVRLLLGEKWQAVILPFQILTIGMVFRLGYKIGGAFLRGIGKVAENSRVQFLYCLLVITGASWAAYVWQDIIYVAAAIDVALAYTFIHTTYLVINYSGYSWKVLGLQLVRPLIAALLLGGVLLFSLALLKEVGAVMRLFLTGLLLAALLLSLLWQDKDLKALIFGRAPKTTSPN